MINPDSSDWQVALTMKPMPGEDEPFVYNHEGLSNREEAKRQALQYSCMNGTLVVEVYGPDGTHEYSYDRNTNLFSRISAEAKRLWEEKNAAMRARILERTTGNKN